MTRVAMLFNPATAPYAEYWLNPFKSAAGALAVVATAAPVHEASELESVIAAHAREPNGGLIVMPDSFPLDHAAAITSLAARYRLPAVYPYRIFAELGGRSRRVTLASSIDARPAPPTIAGAHDVRYGEYRGPRRAGPGEEPPAVVDAAGLPFIPEKCAM